MTSRPENRAAFTLVELLVVIAIMSVLAALLLPTLADAIKVSRRVVCANQQKQLYLSAAMYAHDFRDRLPASSWTAGGSSTGRSGLGFGSTKHWVQYYVDVQLYSDAKMFGGVPITSTEGLYADTTTRFYMPTMRGLLKCPGMPDWPWNVNVARWWQNFDYWLPGFGGYFYQTSADIFPKTNYTRFSRVGESGPGAPKALITDNLFTPTTAWYAAGLDELQGHESRNPEGMNVTAGDGSGKFVPYSSTSGNTSAFQRAPMGYYTQIGWYSFTSPVVRQGMSFVGPDGLAVGGDSYWSPAQYTKWKPHWY